MNENLRQKIKEVDAITADLKSSEMAILLAYQGIPCEKLNILRTSIRKSGASFKVVKNTLLKRAFDETSVKGQLDSFLKGPTAVIWTDGDIVAPAKAIADFLKDNAKDNESVSLKVGALNISGKDASGVGKMMTVNEIKDLANMPSKEQMFAKLLSLFNAPAQKLLSTISAPAASLVRVIEAHKKKLEGGN